MTNEIIRPWLILYREPAKEDRSVTIRQVTWYFGTKAEAINYASTIGDFFECIVGADKWINIEDKKNG